MGYADVRGQRIYYADGGGDRPAVLWSHGFFMDHQMWEPQLEVLAGRYRSVTWDERPWGQTVASDEPFTYWDLADDAVALLDHLGIDTAVWCGLSQGGFLSLRAALAHPDRVRALVLIDTSPHAEHPDVKALYRAMFDQAVRDGNGAEQLAAVGGMLFGPGYDASLWLGKLTARPPVSIAAGFDCMAERDDISSRLGEITCPALVLHGELDVVFPIDVAEAWAAHLPGLGEFVRVPGAGHTANLENPRATNEALQRFLDTVT